MITKKTIDCINAVFFLLFIICAFLFTFLRENETYSYYENRNLASMPTMTTEGMLDGIDFSAVETYLSDHAPGRNTALKIRTWTDLYLLRRPVVNDTVILRDEHILLPYTKHEYDANTLNPSWIKQGAERISETLAGHAELTRSYGGYFCYIAVPCQYVCYEDVYPSYLNSRHTYTERSSEALYTCLDEKMSRISTCVKSTNPQEPCGNTARPSTTTTVYREHLKPIVYCSKRSTAILH